MGDKMESTNNTGIASTGPQAAASVEESAKKVVEAAQAEAVPTGAEEPKKETVTEQKVEPAKEDTKFASKFAALSRKEKAVAQREKQLEKRTKELEQRLKQLEDSATKETPKQVESLEKRLSKDPLKTLSEMGYDMDTIVKIALNNGQLTPELQMKMMRQEIEEGYKSELEQVKALLKEKEEKELAKEKENESKKHQKVIEDFKSDISNFVTQNSEKYEQILMDEAQDLIYEVIETHYNETSEIDEESGEIIAHGKVLSIEEAADAVEAHLVETLTKKLESSKAKKILSDRLPKKEQEGEKKPAPVTLTNEQSQRTPTVGRTSVSREESLAEASKLIRWKT